MHETCCIDTFLASKCRINHNILSRQDQWLDKNWKRLRWQYM